MDWDGKWKLDGGVLAQQGIHQVDLLVYLFGNPKKCVSSIENRVNKLQAEDTHTSLIIFKKNNLSCSVNMSTAFRPKDFEASIKIYCKKKQYFVRFISIKKKQQEQHSFILNKLLYLSGNH